MTPQTWESDPEWTIVKYIRVICWSLKKRRKKISLAFRHTDICHNEGKKTRFHQASQKQLFMLEANTICFKEPQGTILWAKDFRSTKMMFKYKGHRYIYQHTRTQNIVLSKWKHCVLTCSGQGLEMLLTFFFSPISWPTQSQVLLVSIWKTS